MTISTQKRSVMTLFSGAEDIGSHQVRTVLAEKGTVSELEIVDPNALPEDLLELNPYRSLPTLIDRDLVLYEPRIIMEYLDERFPHPPLMPVYPIARAHSRLMMYRMQRDWYDPLSHAQKQAQPDAMLTTYTHIRAELEAIEQVFESFEYFMSEEFSLVDCYVAPLLWRMAGANVLPDRKAQPAFHAYVQRLFSHPSFSQSLTGQERQWVQ